MNRSPTSLKLAGILLIGAITLGIGLRFYLKETVPGLLAGFPSAVLGIWISVEIVEGLLKEREEREWKPVVQRANQVISRQLIQISVEYLTLLNALGRYVDLINTNRLTPSTAELISQLHAALLLTKQNFTKEQMLAIYPPIASRLERIQDMTDILLSKPGVTPQTMEMLESLMETGVEWRQWNLLDERSPRRPEGMQDRCLKVLEAAKDLACYLTSNGTKVE